MSRPNFNASHLAAAMHSVLRPRVRDAGADPEGVAQHPDELVGLNASLHILTKDVADKLVKHYPGFLWAVQPDPRGGIMNILCLNFSSQWGYTIKLVHLQADPSLREVIRAGGEILRRFRYPGTRYDRELANSVPRGADGEAIPDLSDMKASRKRDQSEADLAIAEGRAEVIEVDGSRILQVRPK